jgi:hypothetical protein
LTPETHDDGAHRELSEADLDGATIYSEGWVAESPDTFAVWYELRDGSLALWTFTLGAPLGQNPRPRIVYGPDQ